MSAPTVLTIILNYKTAEMTLRSAEAARDAMKDLPGEITIVDNDSQDGSFEAIQAHVAKEGWDRVRVIQSGHNGGYGAGNNVGIRAGLSDGGRPDYVYILNSDAFPQPDAIRVLYDYLETHPQVGFAGSYIYGEDGVKHTTSFRFPSLLSEFEGAINFGPVTRLLRKHRVSIEDLDETARVDWFAGASVMMRQSLLDQIGLFDETFFLYFEETDLCLRAEKEGFSKVYVRESEVMHLGSVSTGMKTWIHVPEYWFQSRFHYFRKNHGLFYASLATLIHLSAGSLHFLRCKLTGKDHGIAPHFLRTMARHDFAAILGSMTGRNRPRTSTPDPQIGE